MSLPQNRDILVPGKNKIGIKNMVMKTTLTNDKSQALNERQTDILHVILVVAWLVVFALNFYEVLWLRVTPGW